MKLKTVIYNSLERMHMINAASFMETNNDNINEVRLRIMDSHKTAASQRTKAWGIRKEQINKHLKEDNDIITQMDIEMATFLEPRQSFSNGRYHGPRYHGTMPPEYHQAMAAAKNDPDWRVQDKANKFEQSVREVFADLEKTMKHVRVPTSPGTRYHSGLSEEIFEQPEKPGLATLHTANHDRLMKVLTQEKIILIN